MTPEPTSLNSIKPSPMLDVEAEEGGVNWADPRIQSWSGASRQENQSWLDQVLSSEASMAFMNVSYVSQPRGWRK